MALRLANGKMFRVGSRTVPVGRVRFGRQYSKGKPLTIPLGTDSIRRNAAFQDGIQKPSSGAALGGRSHLFSLEWQSPPAVGDEFALPLPPGRSLAGSEIAQVRPSATPASQTRQNWYAAEMHLQPLITVTDIGEIGRLVPIPARMKQSRREQTMNNWSPMGVLYSSCIAFKGGTTTVPLQS